MLGLSDAEFYRLTPRQFHLLIDQHRARTDHQELLFGIVASAVTNGSYRRPEKGTVPADYMPSRYSDKARQPRKRINRQQIATDLRAFFSAQMSIQNKQKPVNG